MEEAQAEEDQAGEGQTGEDQTETFDSQQAWTNWQNRARVVVDGHFTMPNIDEKVECIAWEIFEEIIRIHRTGFRFTKQTADRKTKCSQRIEHVIQQVKDFTIIRQRLSEGGNICDLATSPRAFAETTARILRKNSKRGPKESTGQGRCGAKALGAVGKTYMSQADISRLKAEVPANAKPAKRARVSKGKDQQQEPRSTAEQATILANDYQYLPQSATLPTSGQFHTASFSTSHIDNDALFDFDRDLGSAMQPIFHGGNGYSINDEAIAGEPTFECPIGGFPLDNQQNPLDTQHWSRRGEESGCPSQLVPAHGFLQARSGLPSENICEMYDLPRGSKPRKRRRMDSAPNLEGRGSGVN